jgi:protoporphyrinogen oxidase
MTGHSGTVVIMGAGPAGLAAGFALSRAGWSVEVFELAGQVGGLARTLVNDGFRFDIGGHRWFTKKDELNHFLIDLLGDELVLTDRISRIYFDGKFVDYPLKVGDVVSRIGPVTSMRAVGDFVVSKASHTLTNKPIVSMEDAYVAQFGRTLYELFFKRYSEKVWGEACADLSGDWVTQRSRGLSLLTTVREAVKRNDTKVESLVERFMYPRLGYGRISERMAEGIERDGGAVHLGWRVVAVQHDGSEVASITVSDGAHERIIGGDAFVSSIPMTELIQILRPAAADALLEAARGLTYRDLITVHLMLDRPQVTNDTWVYVHDPSVSFARLHEPRNWSPDMAPEGKTSLVLEVFCEAGDANWQRADGEICETTERELARNLGFIDIGEVMDSFVVRTRDAYPRYSLGYREAVEAIKAHLRCFSNLSIVGRGGTFRYNNADHSIETGLLAARNILGEALDIDSVNSEPQYLEERRVAAAGSSPA